MILKIVIPMKLPSLANERMNHYQFAKVKALQKTIVKLEMHKLKPPPRLPATILLTRIGKRRLDDDNLASAFKAVRDAVADMYGVDDGKSDYTWRYAQRIGKEYAIEIEIQN